MSERYIVFDVETPNSANDRICAIGISVVESGKIDKEYACLVNPETDFDAFNVALTGITPGAVQDKPTFPELWTEIKPIFNSGLLIAHNAPFDMSVLAKCLKSYNIEWQPYTYYACTCRMSRECFPNMENYKLNTLCDYLHITLDHHQAHSDSHACAELLLKCLDAGVNPDQVVSTYDFENIATTKPSSNRIRTSTTSK